MRLPSASRVGPLELVINAATSSAQFIYNTSHEIRYGQRHEDAPAVLLGTDIQDATQRAQVRDVIFEGLEALPRDAGRRVPRTGNAVYVVEAGHTEQRLYWRL